MFCRQCGRDVPDESGSRALCGAPVAPGPVRGVATGRGTPKAPGKGPRIASVALSVVVALAVAGAALASGCGLVRPGEATPRAAAPDDPSEPGPGASAEAGGGAGSEGVAEPSPISVDLDDRAEFGDLNIAVSNFTELGFDRDRGLDGRDRAFARDDVDYIDLVVFYYNHCVYNGSGAYGMEPVPEDDPMLEGSYYSVRVPVDSARSFFETRLGISPTDEQLSFDPDGPSTDPATAYRAQVSGDWLYFGIYSGDALPCQGIASVTSVTDLGDNRYRVDYDVYVPGSASGGFMMISDVERDWYGLPADELEEVVGAAGVDRRGSATFEVCEEEGPRKFVLEEMDFSTPA